MIYRNFVLPTTLVFLAYPADAQAELSPAHLQLMRQVASAGQDCLDAEFVGPACNRADALAAQATEAGICWEAEQNPFYCSGNPASQVDVGFPYDYATVRRQFEQLPELERHEIQAALSDQGHYSGPIDGLFGPGTSDAIIAALQSQEDDVTATIDMTRPETILSALSVVMDMGLRQVLDRAPTKILDEAVVTVPAGDPSQTPTYPFMGEWMCYEHAADAELSVQFGATNVTLPDVGLTVSYGDIQRIGGRDTAFHVTLMDGQALAVVEISSPRMILISQLGVHDCLRL